MAFVLLALVTFGAIAGATHNHGHFIPQSRADFSEPTLVDTGATDSSSKKLPSNGDCLVCQLHQNLYAGLIGALPQVLAPSAQLGFASFNQHQILSPNYAPQRGRAPPTSVS